MLSYDLRVFLVLHKGLYLDVRDYLDYKHTMIRSSDKVVYCQIGKFIVPFKKGVAYGTIV